MQQIDLVCHVKYDLKGNIEQRVFDWDGPKDGVLTMSKELWQEMFPPPIPAFEKAINQIVTIGPYKLRVFEFDFRLLTYSLVRKDSLLGNLKVILYRFTRWLDLIYRRLIITASVWKLAEYHPAQIPNWRDFYLVQRIQRKIG